MSPAPLARRKPQPPAASQASHAFKVTHSSSVPNWRTEIALWEALAAEFNFGLDAAATAASALGQGVTRVGYFGPDHPEARYRDALAVPDWGAAASGYDVFCNPPSSREEGISLEPWLEKFVGQAKLGVTTVAVLPHKTSTSWWRYCRQAQEIREIPYRVKFWLPDEELATINAARAAETPPRPPLKSGDSAGFDSAVVVFRPQPGIVQPAAPRVVTWSYR